MRKSIALGAFTALAAGSAGAGALDSVGGMRGSDTLKDITTAIVSQCTALGTYTIDKDPSKPGIQPITYDGTGSSNGESAMLPGTSQLVAPMSRALGSAICGSATSRAGAEGLIFALDGLSIAFGPGVANSAGIDYANSAGTQSPPPVAGANSTNQWKTVLREVYTGMGASGNNLFARDCNSASRRALVANWDNLFAGSNPGNICTDSNPDAGVTEPGLRHAFRRTEESGTTDVFLSQLSLPSVNFQQPAPGNSTIIPTGSNSTQAVIYRALASSPFCNVHRPEDDYAPVGIGTSQIPPMYQVGVPSGAGTGTGWAPYDASLGDSAKFLQPFFPETHDEDPIRRKCIGPTVVLGDAPDAPREEVCGADGQLGLVLPIEPPAGTLTTAQRYPSLPCEDTLDFQFGPAPTRPTGDAVRCSNGDAPQDGKCYLPVRTDTSRPSGFAFDCLNSGLNVPAAIFDSDGNGSVFSDAPNTDGKLNADGRAYNLVLRAPDGTIRTALRPDPTNIGSVTVPVTNAFYRIHSSRSGLAVPNDKRTCNTQDDATDQIGCLVQLNPCSMGYAGGGAISNNPGTVAALVDGVAVSQASVQALVVGGLTYPIARKLYFNSIVGFDNLLNSDAHDAGKDAEFDLAKCFANLPYSAGSFGTAVDVHTPFGFFPLPAPGGAGAGQAAHAICEDFADNTCAGVSTNTDACVGNPTSIPSSACNNGYKDGDETGVDVCPAARPTCNSAGVCQ